MIDHNKIHAMNRTTLIILNQNFTCLNFLAGWNLNKILKFPEGDISFLNAIPPIGTMFKKAEDLGPQSQPETLYGWDSERVRMSLTFDFRR
jgi:hypothetical protein